MNYLACEPFRPIHLSWTARARSGYIRGVGGRSTITTQARSPASPMGSSMRKSHSFLIVGILVFAVGCDQLGGAPAPAPAPPAPPPPAVVAPATPRAVETDDGPQDPQERSEQNLGKIAAAMNQYLAQHGQLPAAANYNDSFGGDPAPGSTKQLQIEYSIDEKLGKVSLAENKVVLLPIPSGE